MALAYNGTEPYIFISYSHKDSPEVLKAVETLIDNGYRVWYDNGIEAGTEWPEYIAERLMSCCIVIAFMSRSSQDSHNCRREIHFAIELKKELLVVYLEDFELSPGMRLQLSALQAMFKYKYANEADYLSHLCGAALIQKCKAPIEVDEPMVIEKPDDIADSFIDDAPDTAEEAPADEGLFDDLISQAFKGTGINDTIEAPVDNGLRAIEAALIACNSDSSKKSFYFKRPDKLTQKQLENSVSAIAKNKISKNDIIALMDDTVRGNGKSGYIVTKDRFFSGGTGILSTNFDFSLEGLKSVELKKDHLILKFASSEPKDLFFSIYARYFEIFFKTYIAEMND
ncbi:MAG: toll/interleukin-1 receptor domain-containing protein [Clostridia bacterium]|nr:toll/interleukin-1 receptor domain-containing protein [Clostridia bacterium]